ncbi:hypothetical protein [Pseudomonas sp. OF001]|uniref:hypothetical protein n=1 Tax=Pseudomonas sp. OF001 TaxID=2772300 RepID=UPI001918D1E5|nr:hypothetical protein [Pseudomonas sp. OF001]
MAQSWPKYSGDWSYPVPGANGESAAVAFYGETDCWAGEYGRLRRELTQHVRDRLAELIGISHWEITAYGFDGGTDETDDRIIWVTAESEAQVQDAIAGTDADYTPLTPCRRLMPSTFTCRKTPVPSAAGYCSSNWRPDMAKHRATNEELINHLMNWAKSGPLMQAYILEAIRAYSEGVAAAPQGFMDGHMVSEDAWRACGREYLEALANRDQLMIEDWDQEGEF